MSHMQIAHRGLLRCSSKLNGVESCAIAWRAPALPASDSTNMPIVIREGKAWGLMMTSGWIPDSENGISFEGHFCDITPFWPWREENLSPIIGLRGTLSFMLMRCAGCVPYYKESVYILYTCRSAGTYFTTDDSNFFNECNLVFLVLKELC